MIWILNIIWIYFIFCGLAAADGAVPFAKIYFVDWCSREKTTFSAERTLGIYLKIENLEPNSRLQFDLQISPTEHDANSKEYGFIKVNKNINIGNRRSFQWLKKVKLRKIEAPGLDPEHVWNARLFWRQPESGKGGGAGHAVRVLYEKTDRLYQITGGNLCTWQTTLTRDSGNYQNFDQDEMTITRDVTANFGSTTLRGPDMRHWDHYIAHPPLTHIPVLNWTGVLSPWLFFWEARASDSYPKLWASESWTLKRGERGFVGRRLTFERYPAIELRRVKAGKCHEWKPYRTGYLDSGKITLEFHVLDPEMIDAPGALEDFMATHHPPINTCVETTLGKFHPQFRIPTEAQELLFFYPKREDAP